MAEAQVLKTFTQEEYFYQDLNEQNQHFMARINERAEISHAHTGTSNDGPQIASSGITDGAITKQKLANEVLQITLPSGLIAPFACSTPPSGWLECNGQAISRTTYAALFAAIGTTFGAGDGSTTFNVPDLRGEFIRGWDNSRGIDSGRTFGSSQADALKSHTHTVNDQYFNPTNGTNYGTWQDQYQNGYLTSRNINTGATGDTETRPRNIALMYCIKY